MARCPHKNVQEFTECCLDCGRNIYETDEEYFAYLLQKKRSQQQTDRSNRIEELEKELGIKHPGNANQGYNESQGGW